MQTCVLNVSSHYPFPRSRPLSKPPPSLVWSSPVASSPPVDSSTCLLRGKASTSRAADSNCGPCPPGASQSSDQEGDQLQTTGFLCPYNAQDPEPSVALCLAWICESTRCGTWQPSPSVWLVAWIRSLKKAFPEDQSQEMLSESPRRVVSGSAAYGKNLR